MIHVVSHQDAFIKKKLYKKMLRANGMVHKIPNLFEHVVHSFGTVVATVRYVSYV